MKPYREQNNGDFSIRFFSKDLKSEELKWHYDEQDRYVIPLNENDWQFQLDDCLPQAFNNPIFIPKGKFHRAIKGTTNLECKIFKRGIHKMPLNESKTIDVPPSSRDLYRIHRELAIPLTDSFLRMGSRSWCDMVNMLREDYKRGKVILSLDEEFIVNSRAGEYGIYNGQKVPLEVPFLFQQTDESKPTYAVFVECNNKTERIVF